jgi:hypothetical protein
MGFQQKYASLAPLLLLCVASSWILSTLSVAFAAQKVSSSGQRRHATARSQPNNPRAVRSASAEIPNAHLAPTVVHGLDAAGESVVVDTETIYESSEAIYGDDCDACGHNICCCSPTGYLFDWTRADLWVGTTGFVGPANHITSNANSSGAVEGSFGFQEGFNFGSSLPSLLSGQMGAQVGMRFVQAQLDGSASSSDDRQQVFATAGMFRRVDYGLQGGLVVDYLHDDWSYRADYLQLRGEVSYLLTPCHDFGFRFTDSQKTDITSATIAGVTRTFELSALNNYRFFYRYRYGERSRGLAEVQAGWTEDSGTVLGLDLKTPLQNQLGLVTNATYVIPPRDASPGFASEGWNLGLAIVWTPGRMFGLSRDYYRPLFDVADNGSLLSQLE